MNNNYSLDYRENNNIMSGNQWENLNDQIAKSGCYCLNEDTRHPFTNLLLVGDQNLPLKSDTDEQLLLHLTFNQTVKLNEI